MGTIVCAEYLLLSGRLLSRARLYALVFGGRVHAAEGGFDRRCFHAHALGAIGAGVRYFDTTVMPVGADEHFGQRGGLHLYGAWQILRSRSAAGQRATIDADRCAPRCALNLLASMVAR